MDAPPETRPAPAGQTATQRLLLLGVLALGILTRLSVLDADEGWFDEIFTIYTAMQPLGDLLRDALIEQTNPPGYYLVAHTWGALANGDVSIGWHRLLPALAGAMTPAVLMLAARRLGMSTAASALAGVLAVAAPLPWQMSLEIRAYAGVALLTSVAIWVAAGLATAEQPPTTAQRNRLAALFVGMVALHYVAALAVFGITLGVLAARQRRDAASATDMLRRAVALGAPAALMLGTWMVVAARYAPALEGRNIAWIPVTSTLRVLSEIPALILGSLSPLGPLLSAAALLAAVLLLLLQVGSGSSANFVPEDAGPRSHARRDAARFLLFAALLPIALLLAIHLWRDQRFWVPRYASTLLPALLLVAASGLDALPLRWQRSAALCAGAWWLTAGAFGFAERWPKPEWSALMAALAPSGAAQLCADGSYAGLPFMYHARLAGRDEIRVVSPSRCAPQPGLTWFVYEARAGSEPPTPPNLVLGPRLVLSRGVQDLDARRVVGWRVPEPELAR